jgi:rhodopsin kinase
MGGLDNLVANTAYLKAQGGDDKEMKKRRRSLSLPKSDQLAAVRASVKKEYETICERQPIGKKFFRQYLASNPDYKKAADFLDDLTDWDLAEAAAKTKAQQNIINKYCKNPPSFITGDNATKCKAVTDKDFEELMKGKVWEEVRQYLKAKPFTDFQASPFYDKYLQWKEFEKQPISDKYFYEFRTLGKGGFGEVCAVQVKNTGQMYACKKLCKKRLKKKGGEKMALLEKQILEKVNSRFLVNLSYAYDTKESLCLVMTLMNGGDLRYHIYNIGYDGLGKDKGVEMKRIIHYTAQITCGILHLHEMNIVYRDMKPENVLLDSDGQCRLSDLGLAIEMEPSKTCTQMAGTGAYMAPELLNKTPYRTSVDWWALGCSIYEMVCGYTPFKGPDSLKVKIEKEEVQRRIASEEPKYDHKFFDAPTKDIIQQFLKKKIEERLGMKDNMADPRKHAWFKSINFPRLEAGLVKPPWVPKPNVVYAKDTGDIAEFSEIKGMVFDAKDDKFFKEFSTGAVAVQWQQEMLDTGLFDELNDPNRKESVAGGGDEGKSGTCTLL